MATISAIGELGQVEVEERRIGDEGKRHLRPDERGLHLVGRRGPNDHRTALCVRLAKRVDVDRVEYQRVSYVDLALERDLGDAPYGWPKDAVDGALLALLGSGNVRAERDCQ